MHEYKKSLAEVFSHFKSRHIALFSEKQSAHAVFPAPIVSSSNGSSEGAAK